ncbi:hypothetical protein [Actinokineospora sp.]|uniref:hypothetical protein n=1 Tax=Actinokineospora sp. TaxID=1872133 RepID=UPI0040379280
MAQGTSKRWRQAAVWLHVITSVGWMGQALALFTLSLVTFTSGDPAVRISATSMAHTLDIHLLAPLANASAFTGFALAAATSWGFFRHWWVLAKFAITLVQLYLGIFILSDALQDTVVAARAGDASPMPLPLIMAAAMMAGAIAFQAWLSVAKPWQRTPWTTGTRAAKPPTAPTWVFVAAVGAPVADFAIGIVLGFPSPLVSLVVLAILIVRRSRRSTSGKAPAVGREPARATS